MILASLRKFWAMPAERKASSLCLIGFAGLVIFLILCITVGETVPVDAFGCFTAYTIGTGALYMLKVKAPAGEEKHWAPVVYGTFSWLMVCCYALPTLGIAEYFGYRSELLWTIAGWTQGILAIIAFLGIVRAAVISFWQEYQNKRMSKA